MRSSPSWRLLAMCLLTVATTACAGRLRLDPEQRTLTRVADRVTFGAEFGELDPGTTLRWDFGDGERGEGAPVHHAWQRPGEYTVTLDVEEDGAVQRTRTTVVVRPLQPHELLLAGTGSMLSLLRPGQNLRGLDQLITRVAGHVPQLQDLLDELEKVAGFNPLSLEALKDFGVDLESGVGVALESNDLLCLIVGYRDPAQFHAGLSKVLARQGMPTLPQLVESRPGQPNLAELDHLAFAYARSYFWLVLSPETMPKDAAAQHLRRLVDMPLSEAVAESRRHQPQLAALPKDAAALFFVDMTQAELDLDLKLDPSLITKAAYRPPAVLPVADEKKDEPLDLELLYGAMSGSANNLRLTLRGVPPEGADPNRMAWIINDPPAARSPLPGYLGEQWELMAAASANLPALLNTLDEDDGRARGGIEDLLSNLGLNLQRDFLARMTGRIGGTVVFHPEHLAGWLSQGELGLGGAFIDAFAPLLIFELNDSKALVNRLRDSMRTPREPYTLVHESAARMDRFVVTSAQGEHGVFVIDHIGRSLLISPNRADADAAVARRPERRTRGDKDKGWPSQGLRLQLSATRLLNTLRQTASRDDVPIGARLALIALLANAGYVSWLDTLSLEAAAIDGVMQMAVVLEAKPLPEVAVHR